MAKGWRRADVGRRLSWGDLKDFINNLPPTGESALWRARKPNSWWVTPEYVALKEISHSLAMRMWQAAGGKKGGGPKPAPPKLPQDKEPSVHSTDELTSKRRSQSEHLKRRRAERKRKEVSSIGER